MELFYYIASFWLFAIAQALFINGFHIACKGKAIKNEITGKIYYDGMIIYKMFPIFFERNRNNYWLKGVFYCVKCQASVIGGLMFWGCIIPIFGIHLWELFLWVADILILVPLNWIIYKKL